MMQVTILIPVFNEEEALPQLFESLERLDPAPDEILLVDGGSEDESLNLAKRANIKTVNSAVKGRGAQVNLGVKTATRDIICVLHADSELPIDAVAIMRSAMQNQSLALSSFMPRVIGKDGTRWGSTLHNFLKTWYIPMLARPVQFLRGARLLYGDHAMFFRREDFCKLGGCDENAPIMEEAELCMKFTKLGRIRMVPHWVNTSDRRIAHLGRWRANWMYFKVGMMWALGARKNLSDHYPDIR